MQVFKKWWKKALQIVDWNPGDKHPDTDPRIFKNVWSYDLVRRKLKGRCHECGYVVSDDTIKVRELFYCCSHKDCTCARVGNSKIHQVCDACYDMYHALYLNKGLQDKDYFLNLNKRRPRDDDWRNKRDKLGL